ncbi:hypothetical protein GXW83_20925 [Streptacidiphilus sp. PB12-B1b]|uniref:peptide-N4-asparagine amidase n=1 Tax=Streptacidiphilus sp. PB12-B1b TaxID=2705012 RepID=UPI0015F931ED|nr:peptide-N4-asparagine amidase [Streptacidiphilus sp. PB12-B1b]QMU77787.1 hypothetical protein GXW83_20925 [Streptacidiphilus sp. PB12-B1b]
MRRPRLKPLLTCRAVVGAALLALGVGLAAAPTASARPVGAAAHAHSAALPAAAAPGIEINSQNPVTAEPPVTRPRTHSCTQTLADAFPSNSATGAPQSFSGTLAPPSGCAGPWSKVVLDWTTSVQGNQYDRSGSLDIGSTMVYFGTTYEPDPAGKTYHVAKDLTEYSALLRTAHSYSGGIGNYTNSVDTGVYVQTVTLTYYQADRAAPAPAEPDAVVGLGSQDADATQPTVHLAAAGLPRNITHAYLEVYIKGNGCDEQWFTDVPDDVSADFPSAGLCGSGPYREVDAAVDGRPAGVAQYFPYVYTGGIVPTLWRPIPAVGTFDMTPELLDVTPFAGELVDGGSHDVALTVADAGDVWNLSANLLLYTDHGAATTSGALTEDTIAPTAVMTQHESTAPDGSVTADVGARRSWTTSGYVITSAGRETTTVSQQVAFDNVDVVSRGGSAQDVTEHDQGRNVSVTTDARGSSQVSTHQWSYPITVDADFQGTDNDDFALAATVDMTRQLADAQSTRRVRGDRTVFPGLPDPSQAGPRSTDRVHSTGVLTVVGGTATQAGGQAWQRYSGTDDVPGQWYDHYLAAKDGDVTADVLRVSAG